MIEFASWLFDPAGFVSHEQRTELDDKPMLKWMHIGGELFTWLALLTIPLVLLYFSRRRELRYQWFTILFTGFILTSAFGYFVDALLFKFPLQRLAAVWKVLTAVFSWAMVLALIAVLPRNIAAYGQAFVRGVNDTSLDPIAERSSHRRFTDYIIAILAGVLALLLRAAVDPLVETDHVYVLSLLAVVFVSWQHGFGPGMVTLIVSMVGMVYFFMHPRHSFLVARFGDQLATAMFFFCGTCCAGLGETQRLSRRRARAALAVALERKSELEEEIARRKSVEEALRQSEATLRAFYDSAPICMGIVEPLDDDVLHVYDNAASCRFLGVEPGETAGRLATALGTPPEVLRLWMAKYRESAAQREPVKFEYELDAPDRCRWLSATISPIGPALHGRQLFCYVVEDMTTRRNSEEAIRESESRFRTLTEAIPQIVWNAGADGEVTYFNQRWLEYTGLHVETAHGRGWMDAVHPNDRDRVFAAWRSAIESSATRHPSRFSTELRLRQVETDEYRWFLTVAVPLLSQTGTVDQWIGSMADIHDQKTASAVIAESEEKFRTMAESIPQLAWMTDADGYIFWYNQRWYEFTGTTFEEMKGWGWQRVHDPAELPRVLEKFKAHISSGEPWEDTFLLRRHDGVMCWHLSRARPIRDKAGRIVRWFGTNTDITEQRQMEQALRDSSERFRTLTEAIPQMIWTANSKGEVTFFNRRWDEYTGQPLARSNVVGWSDVVHADDAERLRAQWQLAITSQPERFSDEFRLRRASDGEYRWMLSTAVPLRNEFGDVSEWVGSIHDIDDQKRQSETLERMVRNRTAALVEEIEERKRAEQQVRAIAVELERSNGELEQFAYIASHDLQEPLRKIQAFGDRLRTRYRAELPESGGEYVERMLTSASRMRRLIDDLLSFSRVATQARLFRPVDLTKLVNEVIVDLEERLEQTGAKVIVGELPTIDADASQMSQLFLNLIANGVKFHRLDVQPVVEVRAELLEEPLPGSLGEPVPACRITVRDNGIGFDEKYLDRIFQVFQRLHGRNVYEGTGVGLAICRKIVERHGGTITAQSRIGEGAMFEVVLPIRRPREETTADAHTDEQTGHDLDGR